MPELRNPIGVVNVACPDCGTDIPVFVTAESCGRSDDGAWQVTVVSDKFEVEVHMLTCPGQE